VHKLHETQEIFVRSGLFMAFHSSVGTARDRWTDRQKKCNP